MDDIPAFPGAHPPFDAIGPGDVARAAAVTLAETVPAGTMIFAQGAGPAEYVRMVRAGSVEIVHDGRGLDVLGPGEMFGHASMLCALRLDHQVEHERRGAAPDDFIDTARATRRGGAGERARV